jgi:hypothetical protein
LIGKKKQLSRWVRAKVAINRFWTSTTQHTSRCRTRSASTKAMTPADFQGDQEPRNPVRTEERRSHRTAGKGIIYHRRPRRIPLIFYCPTGSQRFHSAGSERTLVIGSAEDGGEVEAPPPCPPSHPGDLPIGPGCSPWRPGLQHSASTLARPCRFSGQPLDGVLIGSGSAIEENTRNVMGWQIGGPLAQARAIAHIGYIWQKEGAAALIGGGDTKRKLGGLTVWRTRLVSFCRMR